MIETIVSEKDWKRSKLLIEFFLLEENYVFGFHEFSVFINTLYTVDATEYVTAQIDATFHKGRRKWRAISRRSCQFYRH